MIARLRAHLAHDDAEASPLLAVMFVVLAAMLVLVWAALP